MHAENKSIYTKAEVIPKSQVKPLRRVPLNVPGQQIFLTKTELATGYICLVYLTPITEVNSDTMFIIGDLIGKKIVSLLSKRNSQPLTVYPIKSIMGKTRYSRILRYQQK